MVLQLHEGVSRVTTEYGSVLLDEVGGSYWEANASAAMVLDSIEETGGVEGAVDRIVSVYGLAPETARRDVELVVERLRELGVVR